MKAVKLFTCLVTLLFAATAFAGDAHDEFTKVSPKELNKLLKDNKAVALDANGPKTRGEYGVVPGALLLSSYRTFDAGKELPKDKSKQLVFYCSNEMCSAAPKAAHKAKEAGYKNVCVMPQGIKGWKQAGLPTQAPKKS